MTAIHQQERTPRVMHGRNADRVQFVVPLHDHSPGYLAAMQSLPSHGWPAGWIGRRDKALLVLSELVGLPAPTMAALTVGDLTVADGTATIQTQGKVLLVRGDDDNLMCGPCALARWVHALDLAVAYPDGRVVAAVVGRAAPLTAQSPHLCHSNNTITEIARRVTLLPPIDRWGHPARTSLSAPVGGRAPGNTRRDVLLQQHSARRPADSAELMQRAEALENRVAALSSGATD